MPQITFESRDAIPEGLGENAKEVDGKFVVDVAPKSKLDEFRDNNINLAKERDALSGLVDQVRSVAGDDLGKLKEELSRLRAVDQQVKDGQLKGSGAIQAEVEQRLKSAREEYERQVAGKANEAKTAADEREQYKSMYQRSVIDRSITQAVLASDSQVNPEAMPDIMSRAYSLYTVEGDKLVAKRDGAVVYGADGATPLQPKEWLAKLVEEAPYLARPSHGSGAVGGDKKGVPGGLTREEFSKLPAAERIRLHRSNG